MCTCLVLSLLYGNSPFTWGSGMPKKAVIHSRWLIVVWWVGGSDDMRRMRGLWDSGWKARQSLSCKGFSGFGRSRFRAESITDPPGTSFQPGIYGGQAGEMTLGQRGLTYRGLCWKGPDLRGPRKRIFCFYVVGDEKVLMILTHSLQFKRISMIPCKELWLKPWQSKTEWKFQIKFGEICQLTLKVLILLVFGDE